VISFVRTMSIAGSGRLRFVGWIGQQAPGGSEKTVFSPAPGRAVERMQVIATKTHCDLVVDRDVRISRHHDPQEARLAFTE